MGLCNNLEGWNGVGGGREVQDGWDLSIFIVFFLKLIYLF